MRRLMWFSIGFAIACAIGVYLTPGIWLLFLGIFLLVTAGVLCLIPGKNRRKTVVALLGCVTGLVWLWGFDVFYLNPAQQADESTVSISIEVTDYGTSVNFGTRSEGKVILGEKTYPVQFYIREETELKPGDRVEGDFWLLHVEDGDYMDYLRGKGVFLLAYANGSTTITSPPKIPVKHFASIIRQRILSLIDDLFAEDTAPFARALLLGDTSGLPDETVWALKTSGIYHIVSVSGMHVSILFALIYLLFGRKKGLMALIGLPVLFAFAAVAGFSPSIVRACIMQGLMILAMLVNKEYDPPTALATAVMVILAVNPVSVTSISLQLSAGCMIGILWFTPKIHDYLLHKSPLGPAKGKHLKARLVRWFVGSVSVTLGAMVVTAPLCAVYFGSISLAGVITNLLTLWMVSLIFYGIVAACVTGALWIPLGCGIGWLLSWPIRLTVWVSDMIAKVPVSAVYTSSVYIVAWLIFCYVLLMVFWKSKKKHPVVLACCMAAGLVGALACSWIEPRLDDFRVTAVDVGQGQCLILQSKGEYYMVDCGGDSDDHAADKATQQLLSQGIFHLDGLILTHFDADHAGGAEQLLSRIPTDTVYLPTYEGESELRDELTNRYQDTIHWVQEELEITLPNGKLTIFPANNVTDANESSLCILFQPENCDILITGDRSQDGERELLASTALPDLEILVAGHHGSGSSTSLELLNATRPEIVLISVGEGNRYGHPSWETLERLRLFGCSVYRTDIKGTVIFRG